MKKHNRLQLNTICFVLCTFVLGVQCLVAQDTVSEIKPVTKWSNAQGQEIDADFVRLTAEAVVLKLHRDGREVTVPLASLSLDSHFEAVRLANPTAFTKPVPKVVVEQATAVDLPELNLNVDELLKSPFATKTNVEQFFQIVKREVQRGNYFIEWHVMPPKLQEDIEEVVSLAMKAAGPSLIAQVRTLLKNLDTIASEKQEFVLNHPAIASQPQFADGIRKNWPIIAGFISVLAKDDNWDPSNFEKRNVSRWMARLTADTAPYMQAAFLAARDSAPPGVTIPDPSQMSYNVISQSANSAEVEVTSAGVALSKKSYKQVDNIWIDVKEVTAARDAMAKAKERLASGAQQEVGMVSTALVGVVAAVGSLARANSQEDFNLAVGNLEMIGQGLAKTFQSPAPQGGNARGPAGGGRGRNVGFDDDTGIGK